ncbi:MAG: threonine/serine exporter family protein [Muribaculaceae bacterium]|nr:threonine/serine exporter family protein [Muribaculaceae bacterium]
MATRKSYETHHDPHQEHTRIGEAGKFLASYTSWLLGCGATCVRVEKNVTRMSEAFGYEASLTVFPKHISLTVTDIETGATRTYIADTHTCGINFNLNSDLSALSWAVADNSLSLEETRERFDKIIGKRYTDGAQILLLASLANAAFCRLFGGDVIAMLIVFCSTCAGYFFKQRLLAHKFDIRLVFLICAFISSALAGGAEIFHWGSTPEIALATSVLYLIPGVPFINAASDLIDKHYLCALSRFIDASVLTACLSAGLYLAIVLMKINPIW